MWHVPEIICISDTDSEVEGDEKETEGNEINDGLQETCVGRR